MPTMKLYVTFVFAALISMQILADSNPPASTESQQNYLDIKIDNIAIDSERLALVSEMLAKSISQLSIALEKLATQGAALKPEDRQSLINATNSVNEASRALTELAKQLPALAEQVSETLPESIKSSQQSIEQISQAIETANRTLTELTTAFPETVVQGENFIDRLLDSIFQKITFYSVIILLLFFLGLGGIVYYGYRKIFQPLLAVVDKFHALPGQMAELSLQNKQTSENLLNLQQSLNQTEIATESSLKQTD